MTIKTVTFSPLQWAHLKAIVAQGERVERALGIPVEVINGDTKIEITEELITIQISHTENGV